MLRPGNNTHPISNSKMTAVAVEPRPPPEGHTRAGISPTKRDILGRTAMRTLHRAAAVLIYPAILCLGVACERTEAPTSSRSAPVPRADLSVPIQPPDWVARALLGVDQLVVDPTTSMVQPEDPPDDPITVVPFEFDPNHTSLVRAFWMRGIGCPTGATAVDFFGSPTPVTDPACASGDPKDSPGKNKGLLLVKTGPSVPNF